MSTPKTGGLPGLPHFPPTAKRVIFLHPIRRPAQMDLFDHKPQLEKCAGRICPVHPHGTAHHRHDVWTVDPACRALDFQVPAARAIGRLAERAAAAHRGIVDDLAIVKTMNTDCHHITTRPSLSIQSGSQQPGRPSMGAWVSYGLGSENQNLPSFVVMVSQASGLKRRSAVVLSAVGPGFLPSKYQGVTFRGGSDPVRSICPILPASIRHAPPHAGRLWRN